jgi:metal-responsive CopG/Arc/MetJ family transcriptional regulator
MNKEIITFQITDNLLKRLDKISQDMEVSRSDVIRMAIKEYINTLDNSIHQEYKKYI